MPALELFGRYRAVRRLGVGAFATVWLARDEQLDGPVAVKVLADNWASRGDVRERFLEEARMLRRADSDRVVRVHDIGELDDGRPYFVMTYADRGILADLLTDFPMPLRRALWYAHETALGVAVLHARGIIHRDVKPSNVLLRTGDATGHGDGEQVLVSDLGLAKAVAVASGITLTAGTPGYMPPEQAAGVGLTFSSDVYALGALTYRLLAGRLPHQVGSPLSVLTTVADEIPPLEIGAGLPPGLDAVLRRALSRDPADRQADAQAFARALAGAAGGLLEAEPVEQHAFEGGLFGEPGAVGGLSGRAAGPDHDDQATVITRTRPVESPVPELEPAALQPAALDPAALDPAALDPAALDPAALDPAALDPAALDPAALEPASHRHRGRTGALVAGIGVAVLLAAGLVTAVAEPGLVDRTRAVLAGNRVVRQAPLAVTVPASWGQRSASDGAVPAMGSPADQVTVSDDLAVYRSSAAAHGVFLAAVPGDRATVVRSALRYPGCTAPVPGPADARPGWTGTSAIRSCGSATVLTWVGTVAPGGVRGAVRTLLVEVKVDAGQRSLAERVLESVTVNPDTD